MTAHTKELLRYPVVLTDTRGEIVTLEIFAHLHQAEHFLYDGLENRSGIGEGRIYQTYKNRRLGNLVNFQRLMVSEISRPSGKYLPEVETRMDREAINQKIKKEGLEV